MAKNVYIVSWGQSVYYKHQFEPKYYHKKKIVGAQEALAFLRKKNKSKNVDFTDLEKVKTAKPRPKHRRRKRATGMGLSLAW